MNFLELFLGAALAGWHLNNAGSRFECIISAVVVNAVGVAAVDTGLECVALNMWESCVVVFTMLVDDVEASSPKCWWVRCFCLTEDHGVFVVAVGVAVVATRDPGCYFCWFHSDADENDDDIDDKARAFDFM